MMLFIELFKSSIIMCGIIMVFIAMFKIPQIIRLLKEDNKEKKKGDKTK